MSLTVFSPLRALVCDDVRYEVGGKMTLVGVSSPRFSLRKFPAKLRLSFVLVGDLVAEGTQKLSVRIKQGDKVLSESGGDLNVTGRSAGVFIPIPRMLVEIETPGDLVLEVEGAEGRWTEVQTWGIKQSAAPAAKPRRKRTVEEPAGVAKPESEPETPDA